MEDPGASTSSGGHASIRDQKSTIQPTWQAGVRHSTLPVAAHSQFWAPRGAVVTFDVVCVSDCPPSPYPLRPPYEKLALTYGTRIWVDVNTGKAGFVTAAADPFNARAAYWVTEDDFLDGSMGGGTNWTFDLFMDDAKMIGRGGVIITHPYWPQGFHAGSEIVLTKVDPATGPNGTRIY